MLFKLLGQLIINQLRLYLQVSHIVRIGKRRINWHMKSLEELMRFFRNLDGSFLDKLRVDGLFPLSERLVLLLWQIHDAVDVDEVLGPFEVLD